MIGRTRFVLGGGGAMGAFQAGALLGLADAGLLPDALYGCSAGALNAAFLAASPTREGAQKLATWWADPRSQGALNPGWRTHVRSLPSVLRAGARGLLDVRPLRALVAANVRAHDLSELAVPLTVTTTCLDCGQARHHSTGPVEDVLVASCSLPGLFPPVRLPDGHLHVDGGVLCGVPIEAARADAGPDDRIVVLDCGLAPVTGRPGSCAAEGQGGEHDACGLGSAARGPYLPPAESSPAALDAVLRAFTAARAVANRASVAPALQDPRVQVVPHIADAWAAGLLAHVPRGPRDFGTAVDLIEAGQTVAKLWLSNLPTFA